MKKVNAFVIRSYDEEDIYGFADRVRDELIKKLDGNVETCNDEIEVIVNIDQYEDEE